MSIELKITGESPDAIAQAVVNMALLMVPKLRDGLAAATAPAPAAEPVAETVAETPKRPGRPKKGVTIDHDEKETKSDVRVTESGAGGEGAGDAPAEAVHDGAVDTDSQPAKDEAPAAGGGAAVPAITVDELRAFVISDYLNAHYATQAERSAAFRAVLDHFGLAKMNDTPADKIAEVKAYVVGLIAEKAKAA